MELTNEIIYLSISILMLGMIFPAFTNHNKEAGYNSASFLWLLAVVCQFASSLCFASYQFLDKVGPTLGSTFQFTTDIILILMFQSLNKKVSARAYGIAIFATCIYWLFYDQEDYIHRTVLATAGLIALSAWQIFELLKSLKREYSKYLVFLITAITAQIVFGGLRLVSALELLPYHGSNFIPLERYHEDLDTFLIRLPIHLIYVLLFMGIDNYFFETISLKAQHQKKLLEEQVTNVLTKLASARDNNTGKHLIRTQAMMRTLSEGMKKIGIYRDYLTDEKIENLSKAAPLHDVGKVAIPDEILLKPGALTAEEREVIKKHAILGEQILSAAISTSGSNPLLETAMLMAGSHHEFWNGEGYPRGLKQMQIPLEGRIMALVDVYDALSTERLYKKKWSHEEVVDHIRKNKGIQFDPIIVEVFLTISDQFKTIAHEMKDPDLGLTS